LSDYKNKFGFGIKSSDLNYTIKSENPTIILEVNNNIIESTLFGNYNIQNIISAVTVGMYLEIPIKKICNGISNYISSNNRSQIVEINSNKIILDAYNANPSSMLLAIKSFEKSKLQNKVLILGDMFELGQYENKFHQEIIDYCENLNINRVFLVGKIFSKTIHSRKFLSSTNYIELSKRKEFKEIKNSNLLIKVSRGIQLEKLLEFIS
jgi:UDP-N-acetylmuramoyl-tripeptide--D-alanyl-D-alanine ligase